MILFACSPGCSQRGMRVDKACVLCDVVEGCWYTGFDVAQMSRALAQVSRHHPLQLHYTYARKINETRNPSASACDTYTSTPSWAGECAIFAQLLTKLHKSNIRVLSSMLLLKACANMRYFISISWPILLAKMSHVVCEFSARVTKGVHSSHDNVLKN